MYKDKTKLDKYDIIWLDRWCMTQRDTNYMERENFSPKDRYYIKQNKIKYYEIKQNPDTTAKKSNKLLWKL